MDMAKTTISGAQAVNGFKGLIIGIVCKIAMIKKQTLANLLNCKINDSKSYKINDYLARNYTMCTSKFSQSYFQIILNFL